MTINEALEVLERDDEEMRRGYFCINDFIAIDTLKNAFRNGNVGETGKWVYVDSKRAKCSICDHIQSTNGEDTTKNCNIHKALYWFCPHCGARMER